MLGFEAGTCNGSDLYFQSPSEASTQHAVLYDILRLLLYR